MRTGSLAPAGPAYLLSAAVFTPHLCYLLSLPLLSHHQHPLTSSIRYSSVAPANIGTCLIIISLLIPAVPFARISSSLLHISVFTEPCRRGQTSSLTQVRSSLAIANLGGQLIVCHLSRLSPSSHSYSTGWSLEVSHLPFLALQDTADHTDARVSRDCEVDIRGGQGRRQSYLACKCVDTKQSTLPHPCLPELFDTPPLCLLIGRASFKSSIISPLQPQVSLVLVPESSPPCAGMHFPFRVSTKATNARTQMTDTMEQHRTLSA